MANDKIVTKKTAAKPAATGKLTPPRATTAAKTVAKKAAAKPAPSSSPPRAAAAPVVPAGPASPSPSVAASPPKKVPARKPASGEPPLGDPKVHPAPLEEKPITLQGLADVTPEQRVAMIREAAYYKAEKRGFTAGNDASDWAEAEREIDELLARARRIYGG